MRISCSAWPRYANILTWLPRYKGNDALRHSTPRPGHWQSNRLADGISNRGTAWTPAVRT
eukprot:510790-Pyramimonas_sp.AAC.1